MLNAKWDVAMGNHPFPQNHQQKAQFLKWEITHFKMGICTHSNGFLNGKMLEKKRTEMDDFPFQLSHLTFHHFHSHSTIFSPFHHFHHLTFRNVKWILKTHCKIFVNG